MFVTFEGLDGSGKSTQAELLRSRLEADGIDVVSTREPGGTELGEGVRNLVLHGGHVGPWAEALLYVAARAQLVDEVIRPALERGAAVICERYLDSSIAYQGGAGTRVRRVLDLNSRRSADCSRREPSCSSSIRDIPSRIRRHYDRLEREGRFPGAHRGRYREPRRFRIASSSSTRRAPPRARRGGVWRHSRPY